MALSGFERRRVHMTEEEYLAFDRASEIKHEYYNGLVVAMSGGSLAHNRLTGTMYALIREQLGVHSPCQVYVSDVRVYLHQKNNERQYVYPDVTVTCDIADRQDSDIIYSPRLVVEVLSPSTERVDQGKKLMWYREHPTIVEYAIIHTRVRHVGLHRKGDDQWTYHLYQPGEIIDLASIDVQIPIDTLYTGLRIPA